MTQGTMLEIADTETPAAAVDAAQAPVQTAETPATPDLFDRAICLKLEQRRIGTRRKVSTTQVETKKDEAGNAADPDALHVSKEIINAPELDAIEQLDGEIRRWIEKRANPAPLFRAGVYLIGKPLVLDVDERIELYRADRAQLVRDFVNVYSTRQDEARRRLGPLYDPTDYPPADAVAAAFSVTAQWLEFGAPRALEGINADIWRRQQAQAAAAMRAALDAGNRLLYEELAELTDRLVERLTPDDTSGRPKKFKNTLTTNLSEWLDLLEARNLSGDQVLTTIAGKARAALAGRDADDLRSSPSIREKVRAAFTEIRADLDRFVTVAPSRKYADD